MSRTCLALSVALTASAAMVSPAGAAPQATSDSVVEGTRIHQEITVGGPIHYWFRAENPEGVRPFCVTLRLERKTDSGWRGIGKKGRDRGCCPQPDEPCFTETTGAWDLFIYPSAKMRRKVLSGSLRIHGFSDFGPALTLRLER